MAVLNGLEPAPSPLLATVATTMRRHATLLAGHLGENLAMRDFRKHTAWYLTGYPVGVEARRRTSLPTGYPVRYHEACLRNVRMANASPPSPA